MPELLARSRLLCGHRLGAAGSPENLIGSDRASPGDNSPCSDGPYVSGSSVDVLEDRKAWADSTAQLNQSSAHSPGYKPCQACPKPLVWLDCLSVPQPQKEKKPQTSTQIDLCVLSSRRE